jgi:hypothetical protein
MFKTDRREERADMTETRQAVLRDIKLKALYIEKRFMSNDAEEDILAESELTALRDRFCEECRDFITPPMARAVRADFSTFLVLIDWAIDHYEKNGTAP